MVLVLNVFQLQTENIAQTVVCMSFRLFVSVHVLVNFISKILKELRMIFTVWGLTLFFFVLIYGTLIFIFLYYTIIKNYNKIKRSDDGGNTELNKHVFRLHVIMVLYLYQKSNHGIGSNNERSSINIKVQNINVYIDRLFAPL